MNTCIWELKDGNFYRFLGFLPYDAKAVLKEMGIQTIAYPPFRWPFYGNVDWVTIGVHPVDIPVVKDLFTLRALASLQRARYHRKSSVQAEVEAQIDRLTPQSAGANPAAWTRPMRSPTAETGGTRKSQAITESLMVVSVSDRVSFKTVA